MYTDPATSIANTCISFETNQHLIFQIQHEFTDTDLTTLQYWVYTNLLQLTVHFQHWSNTRADPRKGVSGIQKSGFFA